MSDSRVSLAFAITPLIVYIHGVFFPVVDFWGRVSVAGCAASVLLPLCRVPSAASAGGKNAPDATSFGPTSTYAPWYQVIGHIPALCIVPAYKYRGFVPRNCPLP